MSICHAEFVATQWRYSAAIFPAFILRVPLVISLANTLQCLLCLGFRAIRAEPITPRTHVVAGLHTGMFHAPVERRRSDVSHGSTLHPLRPRRHPAPRPRPRGAPAIGPALCGVSIVRAFSAFDIPDSGFRH